MQQDLDPQAVAAAVTQVNRALIALGDALRAASQQAIEALARWYNSLSPADRALLAARYGYVDPSGRPSRRGYWRNHPQRRHRKRRH
jgi:hypothetical protein